MEGLVTRVMGVKRFGFIRGENEVEYFFHMDDFNGHFEDLVTDVEHSGRQIPVTFEIAPSAKGPRAREVHRLDGGV